MSNYNLSSDGKMLHISEVDESRPAGFEVIKSVQTDLIFEGQMVAEVISEPKAGQDFYRCKWVEGLNPALCRAINAAPGVRLQFG
jgi:hypothetical protein